MKTFTTLKNLAGSLSQNTSTTTLTLFGQLISDQHRYLLQKYFDNERSSQTTTVGGQSLTLTGALSIGATTATLTAVWTYQTCQQLVNFSNSQQRTVQFTNGLAMITWVGGLTSTATTAISTVGVQYYNIPPNISKIKDNTISIGQLKYTPTEVKTRREWDLINTLPYTSDIPNYYFIYNGQLGIFPIPSTTGNILSFNYKTRVSDLSFTDWTQGTITTFTTGSINVVGGGTPAWTTGIGVPINTDITQFNLFIRLDPPKGDGIWYQIAQINSDTTLTLVNPVITTATTGTTYTIGQIPLLNEDFHDMLVYGALMTYFSSIVQDENKFKNFEMLYKERLELLAEYAGTKSVSVDLGTEPQMINPNLFLYNN